MRQAMIIMESVHYVVRLISRGFSFFLPLVFHIKCVQSIAKTTSGMSSHRQMCQVTIIMEHHDRHCVWSPVLSRGVFPFPPFLAVSLDVKCVKSIAQPCQICPVICKCVRSDYYNELHWNMTAVSRGVFPSCFFWGVFSYQTCAVIIMIRCAQ